MPPKRKLRDFQGPVRPEKRAEISSEALGLPPEIWEIVGNFLAIPEKKFSSKRNFDRTVLDWEDSEDKRSRRSIKYMAVWEALGILASVCKNARLGLEKFVKIMQRLRESWECSLCEKPYYRLHRAKGFGVFSTLECDELDRNAPDILFYAQGTIDKVLACPFCVEDALDTRGTEIFKDVYDRITAFRERLGGYECVNHCSATEYMVRNTFDKFRYRLKCHFWHSERQYFLEE